MSRIPSPVRVSASYGQADTFWDICFSETQLAYAGVITDNHKSISVFIEPNTGAVTLNNGYEPCSAPGKDETSLFAEFEDAIVEALLNEVPETGEYTAFLTRARSDAGRTERLADLAIALTD